MMRIIELLKKFGSLFVEIQETDKPTDEDLTEWIQVEKRHTVYCKQNKDKQHNEDEWLFM